MYVELRLYKWNRSRVFSFCPFFSIQGVTIKFTNLPPCACRGNSGQKPQYGLMTLAYHCFTGVLLLIYGSLVLSGIYYCLSVFGVPL
jgi:hypothetical protein